MRQAIATSSAAMALLFLLATAVQYNDPDPLPWMALYGAAAIVSGWAAGRHHGLPRLVPGLVGLVALAWALTLLPQFWGRVRVAEVFASVEMKTPWVEVAREAAGLWMVAVWMGVLALARPTRPL